MRLIKYIGEIIPLHEAVARENMKQYMFDLDYFGPESHKYTIDAYKHGNISRLYNHSCNPNMAVYSIFTHTHDSSRHELGFFTVREVEVGEELCFDYMGKDDAGESSIGFQCFCGDEKCRGVIPTCIN